jgi:hypothetical protein
MDQSAIDAAWTKVQEALGQSPVFSLRRLRVERIRDGLTIEGRVSSYYHKQLAQEVVRALAGPVRIDNFVEVLESAPEEA